MRILGNGTSGRWGVLARFGELLLVVALVAGGVMVFGPTVQANHPGSQPDKTQCDPGLAHINMLPVTDIQPDPLFTKNPPAEVTVTWTFNRAIADTIPLHGPQFISLTGPGGLNTPVTSFGPVTNGDMTIEINFSGAAVAAALTTLLAGGVTAQASLTVTADWSAQPHLFDISENICPVSATGKDTIKAANPPTSTPTVTPTPTPIKPGDVPLGGSGVFPDVPGTGGSSGADYGIVVGVLAAVTAGALALGGAAWYARRRLAA